MREALLWDVMGNDGRVESVMLERVHPGDLWRRFGAKLMRRQFNRRFLIPARVDGPAFAHTLEGRGSWLVPPEDVLPYVSLARKEQRFQLRPVAVVRRGSKTRLIVGKDIRPKLARAKTVA